MGGATNTTGVNTSSFQVLNASGKVETVYVYGIYTGGCIDYHVIGQNGNNTLNGQAAGNFTLTVLSHGTQPQTQKTFWMDYQFPMIWVDMAPRLPIISQLGSPVFSILN